MQVKLDKDDLITLVLGVSPAYNIFDIPIVKDNGGFEASHGRWDWDSYKLKDLNENDLYDLYLKCKNSWK